jgi:hypothetical protein
MGTHKQEISAHKFKSYVTTGEVRGSDGRGTAGGKMEGKASENSCLHRMNIADQSDILDTMAASRFRPSVGFHCTQNCTLQWQMSDLSHAI